MTSTFNAYIITPSYLKKIEGISFLRARDRSGSFGILAHHTEFLTVLEPSVSIAIIEGNETFFAFNGGILSFKNNTLNISTKEFVQSSDVGELNNVIERTFKQHREKESLFHQNMANLEKAFFKKIIELERDIE